MKEQNHRLYAFLAVLLAFTMISSTLFSSVLAESQSSYGTGFTKGVAWEPYISLKRTTFVQFDENSFLDDYAYLAAVPTTVFYDKNTKQIFASPLLYYQDKSQITDDKYRSMDARQGIDYFMQDWIGYCNGGLDQTTLINVPQTKLDESWTSNNITSIEETSPYLLSSKIALHDWSSAENAVVVPIEDSYPKPENSTHGTLTGTVTKEQGVLTQHFEIPKTNQVYPEYNEFTVPEGYKLLKVRSWYPCFYFSFGLSTFQGLVNMSIPSGDRDLQVYCQKNGQWMMTGITEAWNAAEGMDHDKTSCYVYNSGQWSVALTDAPTKSYGPSSSLSSSDTATDGLIEKHHIHQGLFTIEYGRYGSLVDVLKNLGKVVYQVDVQMYPGATVEIPQTPPFGCRNASFELSWNTPSAALGFSLIGPSGEEVLSTREPGVSPTSTSTDEIGLPLPSGTTASMHVDQLGECLPGEHYSLCVFAMNDISSATDFTIRYSWDQNMSRKQGDNLASATEGAVLASVLNAPLLYTTPSEAPTTTITTLYKLGVKNIYVVDLGHQFSSKGKTQLSEIAPVQKHFTEYNDVYQYIQDITQRNDVIFSTIQPWKYWYTTNLSVAGEMPGALPIGPAAYIAAIHGSPVLLIDNHPELSAAVVWHNEFWRRNPDGLSKLPTVSEMYLTGTRVYNFLKKLGYDKEGDETVITLGGQYNIGLSWDRMFVGKAAPGRFIDSPIDISVWIAKTVFYPQIVFQNPALQNQSGVTMINGSSSKRVFPWRGKLGLKITKPSGEVTVPYPVLDTLICYDEKFNTRASTFWGFTYTCADGSTPGISPSFDPIDDGVMIAVNGKEGAFFPDLSGPEVQPFYLKKAGYTPVFSTNFNANMNNLNNGVLLWMINTHGYSPDGGMLMFWDVAGENPNAGFPSVPLAGATKETNPWRAYEWSMGSTAEPDTMSMQIHGILATLEGNPNARLHLITTAFDWALAKRPLRDLIGLFFNLPILRLIAPEWLKNTQDYYDGVVITSFWTRFGTSWYNGTQVDDALGNIHSAGISSVACLPAGKYLQITLMRHGSVFQIMDPWATSWYSDVWQNGVPRDIALGKTIGESYAEGIKKVGILYISEPPQWWWDLTENVCLYGDPDLRIWAPSTQYSKNNHWEKQDVEPFAYRTDEQFSVDGHMPFGVTEYPHERSIPTLIEHYLYIVVIASVLVIVIIAGFVLIRRKKK
jgi:hypothetical protein